MIAGFYVCRIVIDGTPRTVFALVAPLLLAITVTTRLAGEEFHS